VITMSEGCYLITVDEAVTIGRSVIPPSVAFIAHTNGASSWTTLEGDIIFGKINCVIHATKEAGK